MHETERDKALEVSGKIHLVLYCTLTDLCMHIKMNKNFTILFYHVAQVTFDTVRVNT